MNNSLIAIIGNRNTGKTTFLLNKYNEAVNSGKSVLIIDSATEHIEKSLLIKIRNSRNKSVLIPQCDKSKIVFPRIDESTYPSGILNTDEKVYLCDASYYLEKGYDYPAGEQREQCRRLYKLYAVQVAAVMVKQIDVFIFDEIEILTEFRELAGRMKKENKELYMSLHTDEGLADLKDLFRIERIY